MTVKIEQKQHQKTTFIRDDLNIKTTSKNMLGGQLGGQTTSLKGGRKIPHNTPKNDKKGKKRLESIPLIPK